MRIRPLFCTLALGLGLTLGLLSLAPKVLAETVTFLYETKAQGEVEECG